MSEIMKHIRVIQMYQDDASDKAVGTEAEVEIDVRGWSMQWPEGLIAPSQKTRA